MGAISRDKFESADFAFTNLLGYAVSALSKTAMFSFKMNESLYWLATKLRLV